MKHYVLADAIIFNMRSHIIEFGTPVLRPSLCVPNTKIVNYLKFNSVVCNFQCMPAIVNNLLLWAV